MSAENSQQAMALCLAVCSAIMICSTVSGIAVSGELPEENLVDSLVIDSGKTNKTTAEQRELEQPDVAASTSTSPPLQEQQLSPPQLQQQQQQPQPPQYLTNTGYIIPLESAGAVRSHPISEGEISVYVAIGVLTLIAVSLIAAGAVFCYKYSAALRASECTQPIILGGGGEGCPEGDEKLARHAHKSYYQRQKQNITAALRDKNCLSKSSIAEEDSDQDDPNVYGFQGMASTSGLEVNNPMFKGALSDEDY